MRQRIRAIAVVIGVVPVVKEAPHVFAQRILNDDGESVRRPAMGRGLLPHALDPAAIDLRRPPGRLGEQAGEMGVVRTISMPKGSSSGQNTVIDKLRALLPRS